jgi:ferric-dicitrate binding protein FerR (iron transport regulator)
MADRRARLRRARAPLSPRAVITMTTGFPRLLPARGVTAALLLLLLLPGAAAARQAPGDIALVHRFLAGNRMVVVTPAAGEQVAELGRRLADRDRVHTGPDTRAAIRFTDDGSMLRLNTNSELQIRASGERSALAKSIELEFGELWVRATRGSQLEVRTPAGVAAVKGTEFLVRYSPDTGEVTVIVLEGEVEFSNAAGSVEIVAGEHVTVSSDTDPPQTAPTTAAQLGGSTQLLEEETPGENTAALIELTLQDAGGRVKTVLIEVPRAGLRALLGGM